MSCAITGSAAARWSAARRMPSSSRAGRGGASGSTTGARRRRRRLGRRRRTAGAMARQATIRSMPQDVERIRAIPKVELHQHVDGSIPAEVTWELMRHYRLNPVDTLDEMRRRLELQEEEEGTLLAYLDKMHYPLWITQFYENISRVDRKSTRLNSSH